VDGVDQAFHQSVGVFQRLLGSEVVDDGDEGDGYGGSGTIFFIGLPIGKVVSEQPPPSFSQIRVAAVREVKTVLQSHGQTEVCTRTAAKTG
jgi:hypothetical protein